MSFISVQFLVFIALVFIAYYITPKPIRWVVLLFSSYTFYLMNDLKVVIFLILTTLSIYFAARKMKSLTNEQRKLFEDKDEEWLSNNKKKYVTKFKRKRKALLVVTLLFNFGILFALKYFSTIADMFAELINVKPLNLNILLPLGISFYIFQSVGYLIDVYFNKV